MDEVVERVQNSDSEDGVSENDYIKDDFDGYLEEMDIDGWWNRREMDSNSEEGKVVNWCITCQCCRASGCHGV